eukprot:TRINITY_DN59028_c0_g1_i1.p1 TRINITY_DN59028_c0_g1~~TRINITY_DN59028_c0_g1_i1.p1  ORF type:complete len:807 (-),score=139.04 TRINITY_DN59028_c0_g1_i1:59-2479(-)
MNPERRESRGQAGPALSEGSTPLPVLDFDDPDACAEHLRLFLIEKTGSVLRAWINVFDNNNDQRVSKGEFSKGMRELDYHGDVFLLFAGLDEDDSGELTLDEVDSKSSALWRDFRTWCTKNFTSAQEMLHRLSGRSLDEDMRLSVELQKHEFCNGAIALGCPERLPDLEFLFGAMRDDRDLVLKASGLAWLAVELKRAQKKLQAKKKSTQYQTMKSRQKISPKELLKQFDNFKTFLKKRFGNLIRAWRQALSSHDHMTLPKSQFLKAASKLGFAKESKDLWRALDKDDSGFASIDELDPKNAETLAHFKVWVTKHFGSVKEAFKAIDNDNTRYITSSEFDKALKKFKFSRPTKLLFGNLDKDGNGKLELEDLLFLDTWNPLEFLLAQPNYAARDDIRRLLLVKTGRYMKAWRHLLDKDATNRCNWDEFREACATLGFRGDVAGAWRAFDSNLSGYISLSEIDQESSQVLLKFRKWANCEFGTVRTMFQVFDADGSNAISFQEFRANCRVYGYESSTKVLFSALDVDQEGSLSLKEVDFLDEWDLGDDDDAQGKDDASFANKDRFGHSQRDTQEAEGQLLSEAMKELEGSYWRKVDAPLKLNRLFAVVNRKRDIVRRSQGVSHEVKRRENRGRSTDRTMLPSVEFNSTLSSSLGPTLSSSARTSRNRPPRPGTSGVLSRSSRGPEGMKASLLAEKVGLKPSTAHTATGGSLFDSSANELAHLLDIAMPEFTDGSASFTGRPHTSPRSLVDEGSQPTEMQPKPTLDELLESSNVGPALLCSITPKMRQRATAYLGSLETTPKIGLYTQ